jgi:DEAD/DEAH box helicase domain-containing protein
MNTSNFSDLLPILAERSKLAAISRLGFANVPLRQYLSEVFDRPFGKTGSFLADPTFEAVFGWCPADVAMSDLAGSLLTKDLVQAMDKPPKDLGADYRFPRSQHPYTHQVEAWRILSNPDPQSLVVASGTGSGKTECFMVPILDRLMRLRTEQDGRLTGVRALFLYPLNALINSQRERLRAWTHGFGGDIRFCLYNGNTPERPDPARITREHPSEVLDRTTLRSSPSPILVTNATMLEYMLVRTADAPIIAQSKGKLEWVVLDEAHTYIGSQAAEAALLIRRVLFAFGVKPDDVRFVATSATIGDPEGQAGQNLKRFLANVAGVDPGRVHVVAGERIVPSLDHVKQANKSDLVDLQSIDPEEEVSARRFNALTSHSTARAIRHVFVGDASKAPVAKLSQLCELLFGKGSKPTRQQQVEALNWLDLLSGTRDETKEGKPGDPFLPLRAHFFHQTLSGLWACVDRNCPVKSGALLNSESWRFGEIYLEPRKHCDCGSPAYDLVTCSSCGTAHLIAGVTAEGLVTHLRPQRALDEFELEMEDSDDDENGPDTSHDTRAQQKLLIINQELDHVGAIDIDRVSRQMTEPSEASVRVHALEDVGSLTCPVCQGKESLKTELFRYSRLGAPFLIGTIMPTLLEFAPDGDKPADSPWRGRRLLTFNDSRQGTARLAAQLQQDAERNRIRGLVYHISLQHSREGTDVSGDNRRNEIERLQEIQSVSPNPALEKLIGEKLEELNKASAVTPISFEKLAQQLTMQGRDFEQMQAHYARHSPGTFADAAGSTELAKTFLVREFGRRPKRQNNLESMGLVAVHYPVLQTISEVPAAVGQASDFDVDTWREFLKICLDFFVRANGALAIAPAWRKWLGVPFPQRFLIGRDELDAARNQRRWPRAKRGGLLARLLSYVLTAEITTTEGEDRIDTVLEGAWNDLVTKGLLQPTGDGRMLPLEKLAFAPMAHGWICPVTRRILDTTLKGVTPYLPEKQAAETANCQRIELPLYDLPFGGETDELLRIDRGRRWISSQPEIRDLRDQGLWSDLNDRVIELSPYFTTAEHSAQQDSKTLQRYESDFKKGRINLLSCSTTMEMGIDIGGINMVAMNNVPPHPANYLQRTGRAGRRQELRSVAMTLCKSNPHDQSVFNDSRWAFDTPLPAPQVSLESRVIVQRHINSLLLSRFLLSKLRGSEQTKLTCGMFFLDESSLAADFSAWCRSFVEGEDELTEGLHQLIRHSTCEGQNLNRLTDEAAHLMDEISIKWLKEWEQLEAEEVQITKEVGERSPASRALQFHKERHTREYLLRELATRGFLPAYGFPTNIAAFDNLTIGQYLREKRNGREDNRYQRRELASRDMVTALREYAPGSDVVIDGLVYKSAGITLNWHIPTAQHEAREIQEIRFVSRCRRCGASGSTHSLDAARTCELCGSENESSDVVQFLEPAGFAVDFYQEPGNDITTQRFIPVEAPWIDSDGEWLSLPNPKLGRFRVSNRGHVFNQSRGINGQGYALCLECGRAEPMMPDGSLPAAFEKPHRKLRRSREESAHCPGSDNPWKVKQRIVLGHEAWTDVLEIQLKSESGEWLNDKVAATTLAVALRDSLAAAIGIQSTELGCEIKPSRLEFGGYCQSIIIFDRYAAGYASDAERLINNLFRAARARLECLSNCDSACPQCVLDYDQRFAIDMLDRYAAKRVLTDVWLDRLRLPREFAFFGADSCLEPHSIGESVWRVIGQGNNRGIRLFSAGSVKEWDIAPSPLRDLAYRLAGHGSSVEIVLPKDVSGLEDSDRHVLASLADHPLIELRGVSEPAHSGDGWIIAETLDSPVIRWAVASEEGLNFSPDWGTHSGPLVKIEGSQPLDMSGSALSPDAIRPKNLDLGDKEVSIHHDLDGPVTGFGTRFWHKVMSEHPSTHELLKSDDEKIVGLKYCDRYLFSPLSAALLVEIVKGLKNTVGPNRWAINSLEIRTTRMVSEDGGWNPNKLWSNWPDSAVRDEVLRSMLQQMGIPSHISLSERYEMEHGRSVDIELSTGKRLTIRLDQGVGYWQVPRSTNRQLGYFNFYNNDPAQQSSNLLALTVRVEGQSMPTQVFLKLR